MIVEIQASSLKRYPAQLSLATWIAFVGSIQSAIFTAIIEHNNSSGWIIGLNIDLWSTIYGVSIEKQLIFLQQIMKNEF